MSIKEYVSLCLKVLRDFRVIGTVVVMLLIIEFAKYVATYRKKPSKAKGKKSKSAKPVPAPKTEKKEESEGEEAESK